MTLSTRHCPRDRTDRSRLRQRPARIALVSVAFALSALSHAIAQAADATAMIVSGDVRVERASNGARAAAAAGQSLHGGDTVDSGDRITTGADGRIQLRFTDGGIVSLQPSTVFQIDAYRATPENGRSWFSLVRGALRTTTGAISHRDSEAYRLQTPTATIGVRGTAFTAEQTTCDPRCSPGPQAGLRVAVSEGTINVANGAGSIDVGRGEAAGTSGPDSAPSRIDTPPELSPQTRGAAPASTAASSAPTPDSAAIANRGNAGGATQASQRTASRITASSVALDLPGDVIAGLPGGSDSAIAANASIASDISPNNVRTPDGSLAAVLVARDAGGAGGAMPVSGSGSGSGGSGGTGAAAGTGSIGLGDSSSTSNPGSSGTGSTGTGSTGTGSTGTGSTGTGSNGTGSTGTGSTGTGSTGTGSTGTGSTGAGSTGTGSTGTGSTGTGSTGAGSTGTGSTGTGSTGTGSTGTGSTGTGSTLPTATGTYSLDSYSVALRGTAPYDLQQQPVLQRFTLDSQGRLSQVQGCLQGYCGTLSANAFAESASDPYVSWGRWSSATGVYSVGSVATATAQLRDVHYLIGTPTVTLPTSGTFTYGLLGATAPTLGGTAAAATPGTFNATAVVQFASGTATRVALDGTVSMPASGSTAAHAYSFTTQGGLQTPAVSQLTVSGNGVSSFNGTLSATPSGASPLGCGSSCAMSVHGGFYGPDAQRLGIDYSIQGAAGRTIDGVGVLGKR